MIRFGFVLKDWQIFAPREKVSLVPYEQKTIFLMLWLKQSLPLKGKLHVISKAMLIWGAICSCKTIKKRRSICLNKDWQNLAPRKEKNLEFHLFLMGKNRLFLILKANFCLGRKKGNFFISEKISSSFPRKENIIMQGKNLFLSMWFGK